MIRPTMNSIPEKLESGAVPDDPSPTAPGHSFLSRELNWPTTSPLR